MVYHFIYTNGATIAENAKSTVANMKAANLSLDSTWVWADLEYDTWTKNGETCTKDKCSKYTLEYIKALKDLGCKKVGVYANCDYYKNYYNDEVKNNYKLWLADYSGDADYNCAMQQYSSSGSVSGITGKVDMNTMVENLISTSSSTVSSDSSKTKSEIVQSVINDAVSFAVSMANDNKHGYSQQTRSLYNITNPTSFDCSSLVCTAFYYAFTKNGLNSAAQYLKSKCSYTGNMINMTNCGFEVVATNQTGHSKMVKGDIELNTTYHTALAIDKDNIVHARSSEGTSDTKDNSGNEIRTQDWYLYSHGWTHRLRFTGKGLDFSKVTSTTKTESTKSASSSTTPSKTPKWVGKVTASKLNVRSWAGVSYDPIKSWPMLSKGNLVDVCDTIKDSNGEDWYYIRIDGQYYGFVKAEFIKKN